jgi:hypothetical protein
VCPDVTRIAIPTCTGSTARNDDVINLVRLKVGDNEIQRITGLKPAVVSVVL